MSMSMSMSMSVSMSMFISMTRPNVYHSRFAHPLPSQHQHMPTYRSPPCTLRPLVYASAGKRNWSIYGKIKIDTTSRMGH